MAIEFRYLGNLPTTGSSCRTSVVAEGLTPGERYTIGVEPIAGGDDVEFYDTGSPTFVDTATVDGTLAWTITMTKAEYDDFILTYHNVWWLHPINQMEQTARLASAGDLHVTEDDCAVYGIAPALTGTPQDGGIAFEWTPAVTNDDIGYLLYTMYIAEVVPPEQAPLQTIGIVIPECHYTQENAFFLSDKYLKTGEAYYFSVIVTWTLQNLAQENSISNFFLGNFQFQEATAGPGSITLTALSGDYEGGVYQSYNHDAADFSPSTVGPGSIDGNIFWIVSENLLPNTVYSIWATTSDEPYVYAGNIFAFIGLVFAGFNYVIYDPSVRTDSGFRFGDVPIVTTDSFSSEFFGDRQVRTSSDDGVISWGPINPASNITGNFETNYPSGTHYGPLGPLGDDQPRQYVVHKGTDSLKGARVGNAFQVTYSAGDWEEEVYATVDGLEVTGGPESRTLTWNPGTFNIRSGLGTPVYRVHRYRGPFLPLYSSLPTDVLGNRIAADWTPETTFVDDDPIYVNTFYVVEAGIDLGETIEGPYRYIGSAGLPRFPNSSNPILSSVVYIQQYTNIAEIVYGYWGTAIIPSEDLFV